MVPYFLPTMSGVALYVYKLAQGLMSRGVEVCIHTTTSNEEEFAGLPTSELRVKRFGCQYDQRAWAQPISWGYVMETLRESERYDVIHVHDFPKVVNDALIFLLKRVYRVRRPVILTPHGSGYVGPSRSWLARLYWRLGFPSRSLNAVDLILTGTKRQYENFKAAYSNTVLIPTGLLSEDYYSSEGAPSGSGVLNVLFIGRIAKEKGVQHLLEAMSFLRGRTRMHLVCVGPDYGFRNTLEGLAKRLGVEGLVEFVGPTSEQDKLEYLKWCDVLVLPSYYEAFGIPIVEAMAHRKAVVATATEGAASLIEHGRNGLLVPVGDARQLASCLAALAENPRLRWELGSAGYATAQEYRLEVFIQRHVELYCGVADTLT